ncbi:Bromodomain-containing protein [Artomyces pyxidatus]|uniref:Bromodomain-containing protein n=1 Tax=Artomyces pyxidatus TaxID=48021 RepID=A0ACB8THS3_9AGAM|nr:Bromodomain-containing protein [Artomyces pyxidatus]
MSKRELETLASVVDVDAPRAKRRKEAPASEDKKPDLSNDGASPSRSAIHDSQETVDPAKLEVVQEQGLKLWQTVKDAVDKEGRNLSFDFIRLPSKRLYPDYYELIKKPIALDQIKAQLEKAEYTSLAAVKHDLELCFRNAKRYNQKGSQIWLDAKALHSIAQREYVSMTGDTKGGEEGHDEGDEGAAKAGSGDEGGKKKKMPSLTRLLSMRLDKLVAKKDDDGQALSTHFMELPSKKIWAIYYKTIAKPMSFEKIYKHLKRKEYHTPAQFAADVELVFSNAMQFNEDHTPIWEAARKLREHFAKLMADLPAPHTLAQYSGTKPSNGKIKFKMSTASQPSTSTTVGAASAASPALPSSPIVLKVPLGHAVHAAKPSNQASSSSPVPTIPPAAAVPSPAPTASSSHQPVAPAPAQYSASAHHPSIPPHNHVLPPAGSPAIAADAGTSQSSSTSPAPSGSHTQHPLKSLSLILKPFGRRLELDHRDGVRNWALRLGPGERSLHITNVRYLADEEESSGDEEEEEEEEEETDDDDDDDPRRKGKGKQTRRGAGRRRGGVRIKEGVKLPPKRAPPQIHIKLDKSEVTPSAEDEDEWDLDLPMGSHVLELGEKGGAVWKVYVQRPGL